MNISKAREHFSAHYEGTLDPGIKQAFERVLASEASAQAEYRAFVKAVEAINAMRDDEIELPHDLHDRIAARLDKQVWEQKQNRKGSWFGTWWRSLAVGGVASLAIIGTLYTMWNRENPGDIATSGLLPGRVARKAPALNVAFQNGALRLVVKANSAKELVIRDFESQKPVADPIDLTKTPDVSSPLSNRGDAPVILEIVPTGYSSMRIALPGKTTAQSEGGSGTISALAKSLAAQFNRPVRLTEGDLNQKVTWKFKGTGLESAALTELDNPAVMIQQRDQMLEISLTGVSK